MKNKSINAGICLATIALSWGAVSILGADGFSAQKKTSFSEDVDSAIADLDRILSGGTTSPVAVKAESSAPVAPKLPIIEKVDPAPVVVEALVPVIGEAEPVAIEAPVAPDKT